MTGTGGLGKSMMMRHLLLDALENYTSTQVLPLFISLKDYGETYTNLYNYLLSKIDGFGVGLTDSDFSSMLISGHLLLLLDGLDEVSTKHTATFEKQLEQFTDRYPDNRYVLSSRPYRSFVSYARFSVLYLQPFTKAQALALIDKLEFRPDMPEIKEKFRDELDRTLFRSHYEFSTNPLLLTIMLMTFEQFAEVPSKMHVFYRKAFDTLAQQHDASKGGFRRAFRTGLSVDRFAEYFAEFCSRTYYDEKFELTETEFTHYFNTLNEKRKDDGLRLSAANFIYDICTNMCLMYFEAGKYHFTHRSFQEYFCALYFSKQKDKNLKAIGEFFEKRRSRNYGDKTFDMLYDMIPEKIEEYVFLPFLTDLLSECDKADGYWTFLELMYPQLCYEYGETAECINNAPASYLYEFAMMIFFGEACDITSFPFDDSLVVDSYVSVEDAAGNADIVNERDVSYEYKCEYGSPEPVGWVLELDIAKLRSDTAVYSGYIQRLDDEDFCLKREYTAMRNYIAKLTSKQKPKSSSNLFDLFA